MKDHPRIRGEHVSNSPDGTMPYGSSPHTRGAPTRGPSNRFHRGIIPAYAGSTKIAQKGKGMAADHPRIRGEHSLVHADGILKPGSSPHTRGARLRRRRSSGRSGIIPAYAGSTCTTTKSSAVAVDHPRIRGEHRLRLIEIELATVDHPRIRGEHWPPAPSLRRGPGSSPHTRGALHDRVGSQARSGIIPAYAGSTLQGAAKADGRGGSSPHTRGAPADFTMLLRDVGIIPAYAGSTKSTSTPPGISEDHPRIRGEH